MKSEHCIDTIPSPTPYRSFGLPPWMVTALRRLGFWIERNRQRRRLAELDDAALKDIGLSRADVQIEVDKPFWVV